MKKLLSLVVICLAALPAQGAKPRTVHFQTEDGWTICGRYRPPQPGRVVAILVHGVAAGKDEYAPLEKRLDELGIGSLAIDLRGHGESLNGPEGRTEYFGFDAAHEWPRTLGDVEAAAAYLIKRGIPAERLGYVGSSIGANLVSRTRLVPRWRVLLSPGADYRGVRLAQPVAGVPLLIASSPGDPYAFATTAAYAKAAAGIVRLQAEGGHGAQMFSDPDFMQQLMDWIELHSR